MYLFTYINLQKAVLKSTHSISFRYQEVLLDTDRNGLHSHSCFSGQ